MLNLFRKKSPIQRATCITAPFVYTGTVLTASAITAITGMLTHGASVLVVRSAPDYSDTGAPICFGRGVLLTYDSSTGLVECQFVDHFDNTSNWKRPEPSTVMKISDHERLREVFNGTHSAQ